MPREARASDLWIERTESSLSLLFRQEGARCIFAALGMVASTEVDDRIDFIDLGSGVGKLAAQAHETAASRRPSFSFRAEHAP